MKILVTGGAGFIGSNLVDALLKKKGNEVFVIDNFYKYSDSKTKYNNSKHNFSNVNYHLFLTTDITNFEKTKEIFDIYKFDAVIHLAALAGVRDSIDRPSEFLQCNYIGTLNILELMKIYNIKKLIFASSSSVYGDCNREKFSEDYNEIKPLSPYGCSKLACEQLIYAYSYLYNIQSLCLRFFTAYGPRQRRDLAIYKFTDLILKDQPITMYGDGNTLRDYTYIDDVVDGIIKCLDYSKTNYEIINLGGGNPIKLIDMINLMYNMLDKQPNIIVSIHNPAEMSKTISDNNKAKQLLNFNPKTKFEDGLHIFLEWFKNSCI